MDLNNNVDAFNLSFAYTHINEAVELLRKIENSQNSDEIKTYGVANELCTDLQNMQESCQMAVSMFQQIQYDTPDICTYWKNIIKKLSFGVVENIYDSFFWGSELKTENDRAVFINSVINSSDKETKEFFALLKFGQHLKEYKFTKETIDFMANLTSETEKIFPYVDRIIEERTKARDFSYLRVATLWNRTLLISNGYKIQEYAINSEGDETYDFVIKLVYNHSAAEDLVFYTAEEFYEFIQEGKLYSPTRNGYTFEGWYCDFECTIEWVPMELGDVIYAKWKKNEPTTYRVTFNSNCAYVSDYSYVYDTTIGNWHFPTMSREGYVFTGWYWDSACTQEVSFPVVINKNLTFYAKWEQQLQYSISNGEATITKFLGYKITDNVTVTDIEIPSFIDSYKVVGIAKEAFYCCNKITTVKLPDGIKNIGNKAFYGCSNIISINIPDSVVSIGEYAFFSCGELVDIVLPDSIKSVGICAFNKCGNLKSASLGNGITAISSFMFAECNNLETVNIGENVSVIEEGAFIYCYKLKEISFPKVLNKIGKQAFQMCKELKQLYINGDNVSIGEKAFMDCDGLETLRVGSGVKSVGDYSFLNCFNISSLDIENGITTIGHQGFDGISIQELNLPESITTLKSLSFSRCKNLKSVYLGKNLFSMESDVFGDCPVLADITVNPENKNYSSYNGILFNKDKTKICKYPEGKPEASYVIPDSVIVVGERAFEDCDNFDNIVLPKQLKTIENYAFYSCSNLKKLTITDAVNTIGGYAFANCSKLNNINLGESLKEIGQDAFFRCIELENLTIPDSVEKIGLRCFGYCSKLKCVIIGSGVAEIGIDAFKNCNNLTDVYYKENEQKWEEISIGTGNECLINLNINYNCKYITDSIKVMYDGTDTIAHLEPNSSNYEKAIVFALYKNESLVGVHINKFFNQKIEIKFDKKHNEIKIFTMETIESLIPIFEEEIIETGQWS